jgi:hypothetical protein
MRSLGLIITANSAGLRSRRTFRHLASRGAKVTIFTPRGFIERRYTSMAPGSFDPDTHTVDANLDVS